MTIGERIRDIRKEKGLTQQTLGQLLGVTQATVGQYETNPNPPKIETLQRIAAALGVDVNLLISGQTLERRDQGMKDYVARRFTEAELDKRLRDSYSAMTVEGKGKVADYAEDILPRYKAAGGHQEAPQSPPAPTEGKDTTPPPDAPETPPEGASGASDDEAIDQELKNLLKL